MCKMHWFVMSALLAVLASGCGKSAGTGQTSGAGSSGTVANSSAQLTGPAAAVHDFLDALRSGNDEKASKMLTPAAREKTAALNRNVTPPASDTARFAIGKVEYIGDDGARVASTWTDIDEQAQQKTDEAIWVLRREPEGWRVAGVAAEVFPGEPPLLLNFEDPADMLRKQQWVREEIRRRAEGGSLQAQDPEKQEKSLRR